MTFSIIIAIATFMISLLGTRLTILALRKRTVLLDRPNARSNHMVPTPRGGGIAVVFTLIIGIAVADLPYGIVVILGLLLLAAVSLLDDLIGVPSLIRLLVQLLAVVLAINILPKPIITDQIPLWLDRTIAVLLWLWFINLFNFMDGIDGLAAGEMISLGAGFCLISALLGLFPDTFSTYGLIVAAAGCGFIWWNWHPARIFLGDVGSIPIGFLMGYLLLLAVSMGYGYAALILPAYFLSDSTITLFKRLWKKEKIWQAHSAHYYQQAVRHGRRHDSVVRYVLGINILLIFLAVRTTIEPDIAIFHLAMGYLAVFMLQGFFAHEKITHKR